MTTEPDLFTEPAPAIDVDRAAEWCRELWWDEPLTAADLPSERDRNVLITAADGRAAVLKISNAAERAAVVDLELAAMHHLASVDPELPIPRTLATRTGSATATVVGADEREHLARLITVVPGTALQGRSVGPELARQIGAIGARTSVGLQGLQHSASGRSHDWDIRQVSSLLARGPAGLSDDDRQLVQAVVARVRQTAEQTWRLPSGIQHADVTLTNVLADDAGIVTGLVDFGDIQFTATVCDLAVSLTSVLRSVAHASPEALRSTAAAFLEGYTRIRPLDGAEAVAIADLVLARLAVTVLVSARRAPRHPDNADYITQYDDASWSLLRQLSIIDPADLTHSLARMAGASVPRSGSAAALRDRRAHVLGGPLAPLSYAEPLEFVAGEGPWLIAADGRRYLDGYNNVPVVGHANPVVAQAISQQARRLNTNTRYLHETIVALAERITATLPDGLDTCVFVNSGTEANDLAWRLATHYTGGSGGIVAEWAYHGISAGTVDFSSNEWPPGHSPGHVGTFRAPHLDTPDAAPVGRADALQRVEHAALGLNDRSHRPALLMVDPQFTSEGILDASPEYMSGLVDGAHAAGALFLADEVQSGFGRSGAHLWRFASLGLVPDLVTLGKPMGNGHPIAALITRREIADAFTQQYEFFSTFGGNPVSCAAAMAVLDVLQDNQIPQQAPIVGEHLRSELRGLAVQHPVIHAVRGTGLIAGVELRRADPSASRPFARAVMEGLRERGTLIGTTGPGGNVLKIRPPLVWTTEHADLLVRMLADVLTDLTG